MNCNIVVKKGSLISITHFGIYINKLEGCLEEVGCVNITLDSTIIIILPCDYDIVLMTRIPFDLDKQL
jgi:hypothetical protein